MGAGGLAAGRFPGSAHSALLPVRPGRSAAAGRQSSADGAVTARWTLGASPDGPVSRVSTAATFSRHWQVRPRTRRVALGHLMDVAGHEPDLGAPNLALVLGLWSRCTASFVHASLLVWSIENLV